MPDRHLHWNDRQGLGLLMSTVIVMPHTRKAGTEMKLSTLSRTVCDIASVVHPPKFTSFAALSLAMARDGSSGGVIRMCVITEEGAERLFIPGDQLPKFWDGREVLPTPARKPKTVDPVPMAIE